MFVRTVKEKPLFPLDDLLKLREDRWSEGAAQVATLNGLQSRSFVLGAMSYEKALGSPISSDSLRRITQGWGKRCREMEEKEAAIAYQGEGVEPVDPITTQISLSTDGGMMHIRGEGWKEAKLVVVSAVRPKREDEKGPHPDGRRFAAWEPQIMLERHSYQAILGSADQLEPYQYVEGCRRGLNECKKKSAVSDAAIWIERITSTNFSGLTQIVDWFHASERLWQFGKVCYADQEKRKQWVGACQDKLWMGQVEALVSDLDALEIPAHAHEDIGDTPGYFERHQDRMRYHQYRVAGYPIGSGAVESAVNIVVHHRMKRQGRGWARDNAQSMLAGLSHLHSQRFDWAWGRSH